MSTHNVGADPRVRPLTVDPPLLQQRQNRRFGSKGQGNAWRTIINQIPPHHTYIEPFAGWGTVMLKKRLAVRSILLDRNPDRIHELLLELKAAALPLSDTIGNCDDVLWQTLNGGPDVNRRHPTAELPIHPATAAVATLLPGEALPFLAAFPWQGNEFVYADPPYPLQTRTSSHRYLFEMADDPDHDQREHTALLSLLKRLPCPVMISSYRSELYETELADWRALTFTGITRGGPREECLWMNYAPPIELHDYRWLGSNFRERQDINRLKKRWLAKLQRMPTLKRQAMMAAIAEIK